MINFFSGAKKMKPAVLCLIFLLPHAAWGSTRKLDKFIKSFAAEITREIQPAGKSVAVPALLTYDHRNTMLGKYFSEELLIRFAKDKKLVPVERDFILELAEEMNLGMTGLVSSATIQEVGRFAGASYVLVGTLQKVGENIRVHARLVRTETAKVVETFSDSIPATPEIEELLSQELKIVRKPVQDEGRDEGRKVKEKVEEEEAAPEPEQHSVHTPLASEKVLVLNQEYYEANYPHRPVRRESDEEAKRQAQMENDAWYRKRERELEEVGRRNEEINRSASDKLEQRHNLAIQEQKEWREERQREYDRQIDNINRSRVVRPRVIILESVHPRRIRYGRP